jgi:hypothetical protein
LQCLADILVVINDDDGGSSLVIRGDHLISLW